MIEYVLKTFDNQITKYRALSYIFTFLKNIIKFLGFSTPFIFLLYFVGVSFWMCIITTLVYIALARIAWVKCDSNSRIYKIVYTIYMKKKEKIIAENFK